MKNIVKNIIKRHIACEIPYEQKCMECKKPNCKSCKIKEKEQCI